MKNLRIKISLGSFNVELEGESEDVVSQLEEMKKNGLGQMVDQLVPIYNKAKASSPDTESSDQAQPQSLIAGDVSSPSANMTLYDLALKMLPKSESEWILIYGFFTCDGQKTAFTREDLIKKYEESNRKKSSNIKNLSSSIQAAAKKGWISQQNDTDFIVTPVGLKKVDEIFKRTEPTTKVPRLPKKNNENKTVANDKGVTNA